jgi:hypothetical protein
MEAISVDNEAVELGMDDEILGFIRFNMFLHNKTDTCGFTSR